MTKVNTAQGNKVDFDAAINLMDDDIRESLHDLADGWTDQQFFDAYVAAHAKKFGGEEFVVN